MNEAQTTAVLPTSAYDFSQATFDSKYFNTVWPGMKSGEVSLNDLTERAVETKVEEAGFWTDRRDKFLANPKQTAIDYYSSKASVNRYYSEDKAVSILWTRSWRTAADIAGYTMETIGALANMPWVSTLGKEAFSWAGLAIGVLGVGITSNVSAHRKKNPLSNMRRSKTNFEETAQEHERVAFALNDGDITKCIYKKETLKWAEQFKHQNKNKNKL